MEILKIVNNNIVVSRDDQNREIVLMGRGLGFQKKKGDDVDKKTVEKTFVMKDAKVSNRYQEIVADIPIEVVMVCNEIIQYAKNHLRKNINDNIYVALTDHIHFAVERVQMGVPFQNPFLWEIKKFYYQEYLIGRFSVNLIEKRLQVRLPDDEAAFIALHIVNAELDVDMSKMVSMTKLVDDMLKIVDRNFGDQIDKETVYYERFITHLKFFVQRIYAGKEVESDDEEFREIIRNKYQECLDCVEEIRAYIKDTCSYDITDEEMMYLTVHVKRVITR